MAGEVLLINPRRRRRRKKARASSKRRVVRRRRRSTFAMNPRRRRRVARRAGRRRSRRVRRNPRLPLLGNVNLTAIGAGTAGYVGARYATGFLLKMLPAQWTAGQSAPLVRIGAKALIGIVALPMLAKALRIRGVAGPLAVGAGIAAAVDLFETYLAPNIPIPMSDYEQGYISAYEPGAITGVPDGMDMSSESAYGGGAY